MKRLRDQLNRARDGDGRDRYDDGADRRPWDYNQKGRPASPNSTLDSASDVGLGADDNLRRDGLNDSGISDLGLVDQGPRLADRHSIPLAITRTSRAVPLPGHSNPAYLTAPIMPRTGLAF